jgi:hypothetical protein
MMSIAMELLPRRELTLPAGQGELIATSHAHDVYYGRKRCDGMLRTLPELSTAALSQGWGWLKSGQAPEAPLEFRPKKG